MRVILAGFLLLSALAACTARQGQALTDAHIHARVLDVQRRETEFQQARDALNGELQQIGYRLDWPTKTMMPLQQPKEP